MLFADITDRKHSRLLAISENLLIYNIYEQAFITDGRHTHEVGSAIYGDPKCATIADDETWCAVGGASLEIRVAAPGLTLAADTLGDACTVLHVAWVEALWPLGRRELGIITEPSQNDPLRRLLAVDIDTREVRDLDRAARFE